jgi:hypothetical protein
MITPLNRNIRGLQAPVSSTFNQSSTERKYLRLMLKKALTPEAAAG